MQPDPSFAILCFFCTPPPTVSKHTFEILCWYISFPLPNISLSAFAPTMPSATLACVDQEPPSPGSSVWDWVELPRSMDLPNSLSSSHLAVCGRQEMPPAFVRRVSFHACGNGSGNSSGSKSRATSRRSKSCSRSSSRAYTRARDVVHPDSPASLDARRKRLEHDPDESHIGFPEIANAYHQQTLKLNDIVIRKNEQRRKTQAIAARKLQQLNTIKRQSSLLNNVRDKRLLGFSGNVKDLRRTLKWQAKILDEQLAEETRRLAAQDRKMQQLFLDMLDATQYKAWDADISRYGESHFNHTEEDATAFSSTETGSSSGNVTPTSDEDLTGTTVDEEEHASLSESVGGQYRFEPVDNGRILVPEWFAVLESKKCVPLLSKGKTSRYFELVNKLYRLEKEMQSEESSNDSSQDEGLQSVQCGLLKETDIIHYRDRSALRQQTALFDANSVVSRSQAVDHGYMSSNSAKDQYEKLLAHINACMAVVADRDREVVRAQQAAEAVAAGLASLEAMDF